MSELVLILASAVAFALVHAAHPRRFPYGEARWRALERRLGSARRALHALALAVLALGATAALAGLRPLELVETAAISLFSFTAAGSALVLAAPLWPRWTWRLCAASAVALPLLALASLLAQVLHG